MQICVACWWKFHQATTTTARTADGNVHLEISALFAVHQHILISPVLRHSLVPPGVWGFLTCQETGSRAAPCINEEQRPHTSELSNHIIGALYLLMQSARHKEGQGTAPFLGRVGRLKDQTSWAAPLTLCLHCLAAALSHKWLMSTTGTSLNLPVDQICSRYIQIFYIF